MGILNPINKSKNNPTIIVHKIKEFDNMSAYIDIK